MKLFHGLRFDNLRGDAFGGVTAAIVALPLALAFGVSSGAGAITGLYGAILIGLFAALFGGTPSQISGPTGPMTVVMATVFTAVAAADSSENSIALAFTIVMLGGLFQILFGVLRLGKYITLIPYTVVSGFMSGIGAIIISIEIGPLLGYPGAGSAIASLQQVPNNLVNLDPISTGLGLLTLAIVLFYPRRLNRILPAPLTALIVSTLVSVLLFPDSDILRIGEIPTGLPQLHLPRLELSQLKLAISYGLTLATLGAIDSLLTSLVADNITRTQHDSDRELIGQGIGNLVSGLFGGLPGAGATMRTVVNVQAGGKTPISGVIHALVLLVVLLQAGPLTATIPHAVLAGILLKVGIDIIDWGFLKRAHKISLRAAGIMYGVMLLTVFVDLITAVAVGVFVANLFTIQRQTEVLSKDVKAIKSPEDDDSLSHEARELLRKADGRILLFSLSGPMSFGAAKTISRRLAIVGSYDALILDVTGVPLLGVTASLAIENMVRESVARHRRVYIVGAKDEVESRLKRLDVFDRLPAENRLDNRLEALQLAFDAVMSDCPQPPAEVAQ
ncbi:SulP family inorganic anion transporter [Synechococcus sp. PCC 7336]|uniref:SulP family inorganic anion transporter n=1 Tax=Synechococcus sp. PCC 7336 TaxID=195250 RepID=UPI00034AE2B7|nr:SulP family inorganic anion transporter [Synechococcus sp. PCC 7336]